jgi:hypothetical protein
MNPPSSLALNQPQTPAPPVLDKLEEYRRKVEGTNIDPRSLLSTDYFNTFNSVAMLFDMLPDAPELLEEVEQWQFYDYVGHFKASGLDFAQLAIEAYQYSPPELRGAFERKINGMRVFIEGTASLLRRLHDAGETKVFAEFARQAVILFRGMMEEANGIVHGKEAALNQDSIDKLF